MSRSKQRADRIRAEVPILEVLATYGYRVTVGGDREQQFQCDLHGDGKDGKPSARVYPDEGHWFCVDVDAPVLTTDGWKRLGDVEPGVDTLLDGVGEWNTPPEYFDKGTRPVLTVSTSAGYEAVVTPDHEIFVVGKGWVRAQDIAIGDVVDIPKPKTPSFAQSRALPFSSSDLNERSFGTYPKLKLPTAWSEELGLVMGYIFGDGWITFRPSPKGSHVVGLTAHASDAEDARQVFSILRGWASGRGHESHRVDATTVNGRTYIQDQYVMTIGNRGLAEFFTRLGMGKQAPASERRLPSALWGAPEDAMRGFLRGMYATDGSFTRPSDRTAVRVDLYSVSRGFLRDVQLILLQFGIHSRLSGGTNRPSKLYSLQLATGEDVLRFRDRIGVSLPRKQAVLDGYTQPPNGRRTFKAVVSSVVESGVRQVADVAMPTEHSFLAGGIRVHNCFACVRSRDAIQTVREKEGLEFGAACSVLERRFNLPALPWEAEEDPHAWEAALEAPVITAADAHTRASRVVVSITREKSLPLPAVLLAWERLDYLASKLEQDSEGLLEEFTNFRRELIKQITSLPS